MIVKIMKKIILSLAVLFSISSIFTMHEQDRLEMYKAAATKLRALYDSNDNFSRTAFDEFGSNILDNDHTISSNSKKILAKLKLLNKKGNVKQILREEFIRRIPQTGNN